MRSVVRWSAGLLVTALLACERGPSAQPTAAPPPRGTDAGTVVEDARIVDPELVRITTADRWQIVGDLRARYPRNSPVAGNPLAVLLVHQLSSNRGEWSAFAARLSGPPGDPTARGITTLAIDLRGHGESTSGPDGATRWPAFGNDRGRWMGLEADVAAAVDYLRQRAATLNIVVIGSSIGGTAAVLYAARVGAPVRGLALISPGIAYRGIDLRAPLQTYLSARSTTPAGLPRVRLFTASGDTYSADTTQSLETQLSAPDGGASMLVGQRYEGTSAHGVSLGADGVHPELWTQLEAWVRGFDR